MITPDALLPPRLRQRLFRERAIDRLPLTIRHQRIYILPTRHGGVFLLALVLMLVASVNYALSLGYALCFLLTGLFSASLLGTYRNLAGVQLGHIDASDTECGQHATFSITLQSPDGSPRHDLAVGAQGVTTSVCIDANESAVALLSLPTTRRGRLPLGRITLSSDYPLGMWRTWCYVHSPAACVVTPAPETGAPPAPMPAGEGYGAAHRSTRQGDVAGLRDYRPGDALASIAWKAVARGRGLVVREFDTPDSRGGELALTLESTGLAEREAQVSRLAAWVAQASAAGVQVRLSLPGERDAGSTTDPADSAQRRLALFDEPARAA